MPKFSSYIDGMELSCLEEWIGDGYCDDDNNHENCQYDGGDCCSLDDDFSTEFCNICECLGSKTEPNSCEVAETCSPYDNGDGYCDDNENNIGCCFDSGDCCGDDIDFTYCSNCFCISDASGEGKISDLCHLNIDTTLIST